jgi:hypothetical protein
VIYADRWGRFQHGRPERIAVALEAQMPANSGKRVMNYKPAPTVYDNNTFMKVSLRE